MFKWTARFVSVLLMGLGTMPCLAQLPHPFDLSTLSGTNGVELRGIAHLDESGYSVSGAGDVNGDGYADLLIGAYGADPGADSEAGETYLVYGSPSGIGVGGVLDLSTLDGINGVKLFGIARDDQSGFSVSGAGDVNGDGFEDLMIGAPQAPAGSSVAGETYLVFGSASGIGIGGALDLSVLNGMDAVRLVGIDLGEGSGNSVSGTGDVNGDGIADLLIGAPNGRAGNTFAGQAYLVFGSSSGIGIGGVLNLLTLNGTDGVRLHGIDMADGTGYSVSGAGDVNADGNADFLVGSNLADPGGDSEAGQTYLVFGSTSGIGVGGVLAFSTLNGVNGVRLDGIDPGDRSGVSISGAGDVNGDGLTDLLIGAPSIPTGNLVAGETYLVYGSASGMGSGGDLDLSALNGTNGVRLDGTNAGDYSGGSVSGAGDVNRDGYDDLLIGAYRADPGINTEAGRTYLVYGSPSGIGSGGVLALSALNGANGVQLDGVDADDLSGIAVSGAGDVNGDDIADFLIGASRADEGGDPVFGETYLVYGSGAGGPGFKAMSQEGNPPRYGIGMIGDGSHSIPFSRVWVDYSAGDDGSGGASLETVTFHRVPVSNFDPLQVDPQYEWEVSTNRIGYGTAAVTFKGTGLAGETDWKGLILKSTDGGLTWFAPDDQIRNSILHEITLPTETLPGRYALVTPLIETPPFVQQAVYNDADDDGSIEAGESVTLIMDQGVVVRPGEITPASFYLPVAGDSLGGAGFAVAVSPFSSRQIVITLGSGAALTVPGAFNLSNVTAGSASGVDIAAGLSPTAIQNLAGVPAVDGGVAGVNDSAFDILFTLITNTAVVPTTGATVQVTVSPNAAYTEHAIDLPPGALDAATTVTLQPAPENLGVIGAVQIDTGDPAQTFNSPVELTIQYRDSDVDIERGQTEGAMRVHQLVETSPSNFVWLPLPGDHIVDADANTVTIEIDELNPLSSTGDTGIFGNIAAETIKARTFNIGAAGGGVGPLGATSVIISGDPMLSTYNLTQVEIPGYALTTPSDPNRIVITISAPKLLDRVSSTGGTSWPLTGSSPSSSALFIIETRNASGAPAAFTSPVTIEAEFIDGTLPGFEAFSDVVRLLDGSAGSALSMGLIRDAIDGPLVDFRRVDGIPQQVIPHPGGGIVRVQGITNLTGPSGKAAWGTAIPPPSLLGASAWEKYR